MILLAAAVCVVVLGAFAFALARASSLRTPPPFAELDHAAGPGKITPSAPWPAAPPADGFAFSTDADPDVRRQELLDAIAKLSASGYRKLIANADTAGGIADLNDAVRGIALVIEHVSR